MTDEEEQFYNRWGKKHLVRQVETFSRRFNVPVTRILSDLEDHFKA